MLKDTGNSLGVKSLGKEGNSSLSKEEERPQTKNRLLLRPVMSSYRTSDCPGPVMGKNIKNFLQLNVVAAQVCL